MKRGKPMKRTGFKTGGHRSEVKTAYIRTLPIEPRKAGPEFKYGQAASLFRPAPKDAPIQHAGYMNLVRQLPCARCGVQGYTEFCHADIVGVGGKGKGIKSDCRLGWPGCGPHGDEPGCHWLIGTNGNLFKAARHDFERLAGNATRETIINAGLWPKDLPLWDK